MCEHQIMSVAWGLTVQRGPWHETPRDIRNLRRKPDPRVGGGTFIGGTVDPRGLRVMNPNTMAPTITPIGILPPSNYALRKIVKSSIHNPIIQPITGRGRLQRQKSGIRAMDTFSGFRQPPQNDVYMNTMMPEYGYRDYGAGSIVTTEARMKSEPDTSMMSQNDMFETPSEVELADQMSAMEGRLVSEPEGLTAMTLGLTNDERPSVTGRRYTPQIGAVAAETVSAPHAEVDTDLPSFELRQAEENAAKEPVTGGVVQKKKGRFYISGDTLNIGPNQSPGEQERSALNKQKNIFAPTIGKKPHIARSLGKSGRSTLAKEKVPDVMGSLEKTVHKIGKEARKEIKMSSVHRRPSSTNMDMDYDPNKSVRTKPPAVRKPKKH